MSNDSKEKYSIDVADETTLASSNKFAAFLNQTKGDLSDYDSTDAALSSKIKLINEAIDEIGFTPYHWKLFFLNGMGYSVDSQLTYIQSCVAQYVRYQFKQHYPADSHAIYAGLLIGAVFWGFGADLIGRKIAFNSSLILSAIFAILCGTMGNYGTYCLFVALSAAASGGNLVLDTTVFLEFLPSAQQWLVTFMAAWWSFGIVLAYLSTWLFFSYDKFHCTSMADCPSESNRGWRYIWFVNGGFVLLVAILRLTVIKLEETPKFLVANGRDEEAVEVLHKIASKYNRTCSLTIEDLQQCGETTYNKEYVENPSFKESIKMMGKHIKTLFANKTMARSSTLLFVSWALLGISYPMYSNFLPQLLQSRGANTAAPTVAGSYRDSLISATASTGGPIIAGLALYLFPGLGRRGVMAIGALMTMGFFFGYTAVKTRPQNIALSSCVFVCINIYYSCLYAYSPEIMPSSARATGNSLAVACTRVMACIVPAIAYFANTSSAVPVWICGACVGIIGLCSIFMPFEPSRQKVA